MPNDVGYVSYRAVQVLSRILPRRFAYWIGLRIADHFFARDHAGRQAVMSNLAQILKASGILASEDSLKQMARKNFQMFGKYLVDFFKFANFGRRNVERIVSVEHLDYLEKAESRGKGVIMITAHFGSWELGGAVLASLGRRMNAVVLPMKSNKVNKLFQEHRKKRGMHIIPLGHAARGVISSLRHKGHVAMLADRDYTEHNEVLSFFGKPARLPSGPARISIKTGAPIVPSFLLRQPDDTFLFRIYPPILPEEAGCVAEIRLAIRDILEQEIVRNPSQWFMFDDFWSKTK